MPLSLLQITDVNGTIELTLADHGWLPSYAGGSATGLSATDAYGQATYADNRPLVGPRDVGNGLDRHAIVGGVHAAIYCKNHIRRILQRNARNCGREPVD